MGDLFLGLDLGTSGCKLKAFDRAGRVVGRATRAYRQAIENEIFHTLDAAAVWAKAAECFVELDARALEGHARTLAISALGEAFVLVDDSGTPLHPAPVSSDMRGRAAVEGLSTRIGAERLARLTGHPPSPIHSLYKLIWMKEHTPELLRAAAQCLCFHAFAILQLGLAPAIDRSLAARMMLHDVDADRWSPLLLDAAGLKLDQMPKIVPSGRLLGTIPDQVAARLKLPPGVQVVAGGHDQPMGALGAGVIEPGMAMYSIGTTEALAVPRAAFDADLCAHNIPVYPHVVPDRHVSLVGSQSGGRVLAWLSDMIGRAGNDIGALLAEAAPVREASPILLAHFSGSGSMLNDAGSSAAIHGLRLETTRGDLIASFLEGITLEQAASLDRLVEATGPLSDVRAIGGGAQSDAWLQMKADILGCAVTRMAVNDAPCLAGAILGRVAHDCTIGLADVVAEMVHAQGRFMPRPEMHAVHQRRKAIHAALYRALRPIGR
jgi:xylulokinase